jgi:hypothetical protein
MRTIIIWDECGETAIRFAVLTGDYSRFNNVYVNSQQETSDELYELMYNTDNGELKQELFSRFPSDQYDSSCDIVIVAGFLP